MRLRRGRPRKGSASFLSVPAEPVSGFEVLDKVAALPISTWRYHWEPAHVRHLGPMAQDWKATFGLGERDTVIEVVDANGVALVSIQALYRLVGQLRRDVDQVLAQLPRPNENNSRIRAATKTSSEQE